jgi:hypothetical protein
MGVVDRNATVVHHRIGQGALGGYHGDRTLALDAVHFATTFCVSLRGFRYLLSLDPDHPLPALTHLTIADHFGAERALIVLAMERDMV